MLQVQDLTCGYGGAPVVKGVSFRVPAGGRLCLLGPNGCGKTTLLRALAGVLPHTGSVTVAGRDLRAMAPKDRARQVALLSQLNTAAFAYTVRETVMMGRYAHQKAGLWETNAPADREAVRQSLERTDTWSLRDRPLTELSGGQLQRVFLARVFAQDPKVILLDEPTNHLDLRCQVELVRSLQDWAAEKQRCVVGVLHDVNLALTLADTLLLMDNGQTEPFDPKRLDAIYGMDVRGYMQETLKRWIAD